MISEKNTKRYMLLHHGACMHQKSQQGIQPFKLPLCGLVVFIDERDMYKLTEGGRSFKTLFKENHTVAFDSCYLFTKRC